MRRPALGAELDPSRAVDRAADPAGWRMGEEVRAALAAVIAGRRDIRRFRPDPVPEDVLRRLLEAAHQAPSVGLSQPWRFVIVRSPQTRARVRALAARERTRQAARFDERARQFLDQKVEGVLEAPVGICVCCVPPPDGTEVLGRSTIPETDLHSTACAIENLWLTARAEGLGVGWVSFYRPADLRAVLGIPAAIDPVAWLCVGWPDERPLRPGLERAGWAARTPLEAVVHKERWLDCQPAAAEAPPPDDSPVAVGSAPVPDDSPVTVGSAQVPDDPPVAAGAGPAPDERARTRVRDRSDELVKPAGSLGALEDVVERWAAATGAPPPVPLRAAHLICAADHGHASRGTSLFESAVSGQVAEAAAGGETAIGVLARARAERVVVADLGLAGGTPRGCVGARVRGGTRDATSAPAMTAQEATAAIATGARLAGDLLEATAADCLVIGEIGIGNTATAAALLCALTGAEPERAVGRGTGLDAQGLERKRAVVRAIVRRHLDETPDPEDPLAALAGVGGLELAALAGAVHAAHARRLPVVLDGFATGVAALVAVRLRPACREWLVAGHRSAEPAHAEVLAELGHEPLLDLRLRLGEGSGAALALGLIEQAGRLHREMATFAEAHVDGP